MRVAGAGHSFTPLISDAGLILDLSRMAGPVLAGAGEGEVRVRAGARLHEVARALGERGLAFRNLGDINVQSLAGAMATATHGTGAMLPAISAEMTSARVMTAAGEIVDLAADEIDGARVSLGALGVMLDIGMTAVPAYDLRRRVTIKPIEVTLAEMHDMWAAHRHFEFFWVPHTGQTMSVRHDISTDPRGKIPRDMENAEVRALKLGRSLGRVHPIFRRWILAIIVAIQTDEDFTEESWRVLSKPRNVRFVEMEYHLPPEAAADALREIVALTERRHPDVFFPVEVRQSAGDTGWLSPFQGGNRISVAVHHDAGEDPRAYFRDCEAVFRAAGGRPHWGKMHGLSRPDIEALYPDLPRFDALRARLDPEGRFLSPAVRKLLVG